MSRRSMLLEEGLERRPGAAFRRERVSQIKQRAGRENDLEGQLGGPASYFNDSPEQPRRAGGRFQLEEAACPGPGVLRMIKEER